MHGKISVSIQKRLVCVRRENEDEERRTGDLIFTVVPFTSFGFCKVETSPIQNGKRSR